MYKKPFIINHEDLQAWVHEHKSMYCSDSNTGLRLYATLNGAFQIEREGKILWQGIQPYAAAEKYNDLSDELTNKIPS